MKNSILALMVGASLLGVAACDKPAASDGNAGTTTSGPAKAGGKIGSAIATDSRLGKAIAAAGMTGVLDGPGPYTLLAPADDAFDKLPAGAEGTLLKPEGKQELVRVIGTHVLPGTILAADIGKAIDAGGGKASLPTMSGQTLTATRDGDKIVISDMVGTRAIVTAADERHDNGVVHRVDSVLMPTSK